MNIILVILVVLLLFGGFGAHFGGWGGPAYGTYLSGGGISLGMVLLIVVLFLLFR